MTSPTHPTTPALQRIEAALARLRPSLQLDGGDLKLIDLSSEGVARIELTGCCAGCPMSRMLLQQGIEESLKDLPEVTRVVTVDPSTPAR